MNNLTCSITAQILKDLQAAIVVLGTPGYGVSFCMKLPLDESTPGVITIEISDSKQSISDSRPIVMEDGAYKLLGEDKAIKPVEKSQVAPEPEIGSDEFLDKILEERKNKTHE